MRDCKEFIVTVSYASIIWIRCKGRFSADGFVSAPTGLIQVSKMILEMQAFSKSEKTKGEGREAYQQIRPEFIPKSSKSFIAQRSSTEAQKHLEENDA